MRLSELLLQELLVLLSVVSWVILRVSGLVQKVVNEGKAIKIKVGKREVIHLSQEKGNLSLEVLPIEKDILVVEGESKKSLIRQGKGKILLVEESDTQKTINPILSKQTEKLDLLVNVQCPLQKSEKEVNIENGSSIKRNSNTRS